MFILGISALYHDSAAAIIKDGEIIAAAQEERFTRIKHDSSLPIHAIKYCLNVAGELSGSDLDAVVYYDDPVSTLHRFIANVSAVGNDSDDLVQFSFDSIFKHKLWIEKLLRDQLGILGKDDRLYVTQHHLSHAASAFYPSPFEHAAIITVDGVGEWNTTTIGIGKGNEITLKKKIDYPHSLGLLYSAFTYFCGFRVNYGDYKLMGLAPYGEPIYVDIIKQHLIDIKSDGSYRLNLKYFDFQYGRPMTNELFAELFNGPRRLPESEITKREMDIAASAQKVIEEIIIKLATTAKKLTGEKNLVLAGGVALNCVANGVLAKTKLFDNIWIQPAAGDAGCSLGAALALYHMHFQQTRHIHLPDSQQGSFLGPEFSDEEIKEYLHQNNISFHQVDTTEELCTTIARLLNSQKVIGLFEGRMEFGPRSLGHRSIIADPRSEHMQSRLNLCIKYRESFRPFAPSVLRERCPDYFDIDLDSPYMLFCGQVNERKDESFSIQQHLSQNTDMLSIINRKRSDIPAVTHVDYSARIQTVDKKRNPIFYHIIKAFEELTGCGVVINTSFNVRGEPIVCSPNDAYRCFMNTEMDVLVMNNFILYKEEQPFTELRRDIYELD